MKKQLFLILWVTTIALLAKAQIVNIPDANFKAHLVASPTVNTNGDTEIQISEAQAFTGGINCSYKSIVDMTGIEAFTNLTKLYCYYNDIDSLNLTQNTALRELRCAGNELSTLDLSQNTALTYLSCGQNNLTNLDLSQNTALLELRCSSNPLGSLDVTQNTALTYLHCGSNELTSIDVSQNVALTYLNCTSNQLTNVDLSQNIALVKFWCTNNDLTNLDLSQNTVLKRLSCSRNKLTSINTRQCPLLETFNCEKNDLDTLDISQNTLLDWLACGYNNLSSLDLTQDTILTYLNCRSNELTSLDLSQNTILDELRCYHNQLTSIDLSQNIVLRKLWCYSNNLTDLDLSANPALTFVLCYDNDLTCLNAANGNNQILNVMNATKNSNLFCIQIDNNYTPGNNWRKETHANWNTDCQLPILSLSADSINFGLVTASNTVSHNFTIRNEGCMDLVLDNITYTGSTEFTHNMPSSPFTLPSGETFILTVEYTPVSVGTSLLGTLSFTHNANGGNQDIIIQGEGTNDCLIYIPDVNFKSYLVGNSSINTNGNTEIECTEAQAYTGSIICDNQNISTMEGLEAFVEITELRCNDNLLNVIDVSQNTDLTYLDCSANNAIDTLDLSQNTALTYLNCSYNNLKALNVSHLDSLIELNCGHNRIDTLNVRNNLALTSLRCGHNILRSLDVTQNIDLILLYVNNNGSFNELDVSQNTQLEILWCYYNGHLDELDITNNTALKELKCNNNNLTTLNTNNNAALETLICTYNDLISLDLSNNPLLELLYCDRNDITSINLSNTTALKDFNCGYNDISSLDLSNNLALEKLRCYRNYALPSLDVSANTALTEIYCHNNKLISLNVANGNNTNTVKMWAHQNANLSCIQHDAGFDPTTTNNDWRKNAGTATWNSDCGCLATSATDIHAACETYTWIDGNTYTESNYTATDTFTNTAGCDSIVTLNITINETVMSIDSQTACNSYTWIDGNVYTSDNNTATYTYNSIAGCDSAVVTLNLSLETGPTLSIAQNGLNLEATAGMDSYQWFFNGTAIDGATNANYTATENGSYTCEVVQGNCSSTSDLVNITGVTIHNIVFDNIKIYPNPTKNIVYLDVNEALTEINLYDISGRFIKSFNRDASILDVSNVQKGVYFLQLKNDAKLTKIKLIVE